MPEKKSEFNVPPKKYHPKGLSILHEDQEIIVVDKAAGLLTMGSNSEKFRTAHYLLNEYVRRGNERSRNRVYIVHRLDRDTSGVIVFAKSERSKEFLQDNWKDFSKKYITLVHGTFEEKEGELSSYLVENKAFRMYSVKNPELGKFAKTGYKVMRESEKFSLLEIDLFTGRKHQIRVHLADEGHPVVGDQVYGSPDKLNKRLALHSASLTVKHPKSGKEMTFETKVPFYFKSILKS